MDASAYCYIHFDPAKNPCFPTDTGRHVLDQIELAAMFQRVRHFGLDHRFFHSLTSSICLPNSEVDPEIRIRLVHRHDLDERSRWVAALNVQWSATDRESQDEAAWAVLVLWIVFDDMAVLKRLADLAHTDSSDDALINRMLGELELSFSDLGSKFCDHCSSSY